MVPFTMKSLAVGQRAGLERGEVRAGARLRVALAPADLAAGDLREVLALLLLVPEAQQRRADHGETEADQRLGEAEPRQLLGEHLGLLGGEAAAAVLLRPARAPSSRAPRTARATPAGRRSSNFRLRPPQTPWSGSLPRPRSEAGALASSQARVSRRKASRSAMGVLRSGGGYRYLPPMRILLASPRGFCAGVDRAIEIVERALVALRAAGLRAPRDRAQPPRRRRPAREGRRLRRGPARGAAGLAARVQRPRRLARGAARRPRSRACARIDATCPLVTKVHVEAQRFARTGHEIVLVGHAGHVEVEGTMGHAPGSIRLVETVEDVGAPRGARIPSASPSSPRRRSRWTTRAR